MKTDKDVLQSIARAIKHIDSIESESISGMDQFYIDTARELLVKILHSNRYKLSDKSYRLKKF